MDIQHDEIDSWNDAVISRKMTQRVKDFKETGVPIFTYDELDRELTAALAQIRKLETEVFKLQKENDELRSMCTSVFSPNHAKNESAYSKETSEIYISQPTRDIRTPRSTEWKLPIKFL
jgi:hypothetical protein